MSNNLTGNPYIVDTAGIISSAPVFVKRMVWQEPAAAAEDLTVKDSEGKVLWDENSHAGGTGISIEQEMEIDCNGITVETIDSGMLYIYYEKYRTGD